MKSLGKIVILMGLIIACTYGGLFVFKLFGINGGEITRLTPFVVMILWVTIFLKIIDGKKFSDIGLNSFKTTLIMNSVMSLLALLPMLIGCILTREFQISKSIDISIFMVVGYYFVVGFSEELLCRGYIYNEIEINNLKAVISAVAFAGFHFISPEFNIVLFILYIIFGLIKVFMYKMIQNLWPLIVFHMIWDLGATYTQYYTNPLIDLVCLGTALIVIKYITKMDKNKVNNKLNINIG